MTRLVWPLALLPALAGCGSAGGGVAGPSQGTTPATPTTMPSSGTVVYVDPQAGASTTYDPAGRRGSGGSARAYATLAQAAEAATAGTTVLIRGGTYNEPLVPRNSGAAGAPIVFRRFGEEQVVITRADLDPAIDLTDRRYVTIDGLAVTSVTAWLRGLNAHYNVIRNATFSRALATGSRGGIKLVDSTHNKILDNTIDDGNDNLSLIHSDRNVVAGNRMSRARHNLWQILCGSFNVIRDNRFRNEIQKIGQITDCEGTPSDAPILYNATKYNLVEGNTFSFTPSSGNSSPYAGIQYSAQGGIIRRNLFHDTVGPALDFTIYANEARYNTDNRVYNNVFYRTRFAGISLAPQPGLAFSGNVFKNNVLAGSLFQRNDTRWRWYQELDGKPVQVMTGRLEGYLFERNDIVGSRPGEAYVIAYGRRDNDTNPAGQTLAAWQSQMPRLFADNVEVDPLFQDEAGRDFRLRDGSPLIDAGTYLTRTAGAGSGTSLRVQDASWFYDGYEIEGEAGDVIRLAGSSQTARVVRIERGSNTLVLDQVLSWSDGQGVALDYAGSAPDIGAFEKRP